MFEMAEKEGKKLEMKLLKKLASPSELNYKEGLTLEDLLKTSSSRKSFDNFVIDNAVRDHLNQLLIPYVNKVNDLTNKHRMLQALVATNQKKQEDLAKQQSKLGLQAANVHELVKKI
eukprot:CAMPEP_0170512100 /NCGR_PEP_ID=MMETSP0208-20121228/66662_1 /TAXON_ID=197538 /ORGANISM="Strombidium inclinatum, Strain S3" /LENGTH=116 /DNA_ID=CAMNT_0010795695 /DNA_START=226 /DNA_END=576 /DNA_ORIENTATION=-